MNWMLTQGGVSCFLVAALPPRQTNIEILSSPSYVYDQVASLQGLAPTPEETNPLPAELMTCHDVDKVAANLHWQLELPWAYPLYSSDGSLETAEQAIRALHVPPVASNVVSKGIWEVYAKETLEYDEPDLGPVMHLRPKKGKGKTAQGDDDEMWYDRQLKRKLIFSDLSPLPAGSVIPDEEFGRPVLSWPFGARANDKWLGRPPSIWMYKSQETNRGHVGEEYHSPTPPHDEPMEIDIERAESQQLHTNSVLCATTAKPRLGSPVMSDSSMVSLGDELPSKEIGDVAMPDLFVPRVEVEMYWGLEMVGNGLGKEGIGLEDRGDIPGRANPVKKLPTGPRAWEPETLPLPLLDHLTKPPVLEHAPSTPDSENSRTLIDRPTFPADEVPRLLSRISNEGERDLLRRLNVHLGERVSDDSRLALKKRKHNRAGKERHGSCGWRVFENLRRRFSRNLRSGKRDYVLFGLTPRSTSTSTWKKATRILTLPNDSALGGSVTPYTSAPASHRYSKPRWLGTQQLPTTLGNKSPVEENTVPRPGIQVLGGALTLQKPGGFTENFPQYYSSIQAHFVKNSCC
ncbi:hypothetical protein K438DRAFT_1768837 [Mycena galopus ATCC 62051]|nr:hypothetical protein K438DRAFT_1768837 [Mycena galopus ATCC 62051]